MSGKKHSVNVQHVAIKLWMLLGGLLLHTQEARLDGYPHVYRFLISVVGSSPDQAVWVRALAGDIVLCSRARHLTLTMPLSTQVYKSVPANLTLEVD